MYVVPWSKFPIVPSYPYYPHGRPYILMYGRPYSDVLSCDGRPYTFVAGIVGFLSWIAMVDYP